MRQGKVIGLGKIILFSGHMTDGPNRPEPRFPAWLEPQVRTAIRSALQDWQVGPGDTGICGAARGGDIIFAEQCLALGARVSLFLPLPVAAFLEASVRLPDELDSDWEARFFGLLDDCPAEGPEADDGAHPFVANNARMLAEARKAAGGDDPYALILWDGRDPDGKGGTAEIAEATEGWRHRVVIDPAGL